MKHAVAIADELGNTSWLVDPGDGRALVVDPAPHPGPPVVTCGHGERAATAASVLVRSGRHDVTVAVGGPADRARARGATLEQRE